MKPQRVKNTKLEELWQLILDYGSAKTTIGNSVKKFCDYFIDVPYASSPSPLGVNTNSKLEKVLHEAATTDEFTLDLTGFDCVTYVETILALILTCRVSTQSSIKELENIFCSWLCSLRYKNGIRTFLYRNHFMSLDWVPNNSWLLANINKKITQDIKITSANIDKLSWLLHANNLKQISNVSTDKIENYCNKQGISYTAKHVSFEYIDLDTCIANWEKFKDLLPDVFIMLIVRPNWDLSSIIGTNLHVSHLGVGIKCNNEIMFYHASSDQKKVVAVPVIEYLHFCKKIPSIAGAHFLELTLDK